jgi:tRNA pseudouridine13 synthase
MPFDPLQPPPYFTADLPGIRGIIKQQPEDFEVEEIPAYEPCGQGEFAYVWLEKRDMGAEYFTRQVARRLGIGAGEVGSSGLKDRRAVTRQWISLPGRVEAGISRLDGEGIRVLKVSRHGNKLRPGHLRGNRFKVLIRNVDPQAVERAGPIVHRLSSQGLPNYYGLQRFGREGETVLLGLDLLRDPEKARKLRSPFLRKLALSAAQSAIFNHYLARRLADGLFHKVLAGDVMAKWPAGGMFVAEDLSSEQARFDRREIVHTGPIFGRKTFPAGQEAAVREQVSLTDAGLSVKSFAGFGKLLQGTRRHNLVYVDDLQLENSAEGVQLHVSLPAGTYATILLREIMKATQLENDDVPAESAD